MRRPVHTVFEGDTVLVAARTMRDADVGLLPVRDAHGVVVGVITDRDITTRACAEAVDPVTAIVRNVMTRAVIACRPADPVTKAVALMRRHKVTRIIVVDERGAAVGLLSLSDIAQYERPAKIGRTLQTVAERKYAPERP
jgi:CBS domain-containing protein